MTSQEKWKDIPGFPAYQVSDCGRVRSFRRKEKLKWYLADTPQRILQPKIHRGYPEVVLCKKGKSHHFNIHRLVLSVFVGPRPPGMQACHKDGFRLNNCLCNLKWDIPANNYADTKKHGSLKGMKNPNAKLTDEQVRQIRTMAAQGCRQREIAKTFNLNQRNISRIILCQSWGHVI